MLLSPSAAFLPFEALNFSHNEISLTRDHQWHSVSLIVVAHDNLTVVSARVVGAETRDLHGSVQRIGAVSWQRDAANKSLIHLDYITFGTEIRDV